MPRNRRSIHLLLLAIFLTLIAAPSTASAEPTDTGPTFVDVPASAFLQDPTDVQTNIVNGQNATEQYGMASLWDPTVGRNRCGAVVITPMWAVTSAHCDVVLIPHVTEVRASSLDNHAPQCSDTLPPPCYEQPGMDLVKKYPTYNPATAVDDIALIKFERPVKRTTPIPIARTTLPLGSVARVAGWGWPCDATTTPPCGTSTNILQQLDIRTVPMSTCPLAPDPTKQLCGLDAHDQLANACLGDSGTGLELIAGPARILFGITQSDGDDSDIRPNVCATNPQGGPGAGVWVDITRYNGWIADTIRNN